MSPARFHCLCGYKSGAFPHKSHSAKPTRAVHKPVNGMKASNHPAKADVAQQQMAEFLEDQEKTNPEDSPFEACRAILGNPEFTHPIFLEHMLIAKKDVDHSLATQVDHMITEYAARMNENDLLVFIGDDPFLIVSELEGTELWVQMRALVSSFE